MFWGGTRLRKELKSLISDYEVGRIDHASYRLRIGREVYVSPTGQPDDPRNKPKTKLAPGEGFTIPAGQFGFILTEETVRVPKEAMAFISIRAGYKFRGLVNVSGFHVDPNYEGHLIFAVFNAGPGPIHLSRGEPCFLIWYADLDGPFNVPKRTGYSSIPSELTGPIAGGLESFASLHSKINENDKAMSERVAKVERDHEVLKWLGGLILAILIGLATKNCTGVRWAEQNGSENSTGNSAATDQVGNDAGSNAAGNDTNQSAAAAAANTSGSNTADGNHAP